MDKETTIKKLYLALEKLEQARNCSNKISFISSDYKKKIDGIVRFTKKHFKIVVAILAFIYVIFNYCLKPNINAEPLMPIISTLTTWSGLATIFVCIADPVLRKKYLHSENYRKKVEAYRQEEKEATKQYREQIRALRGEAKRILNISDEYIDYDILSTLLSYLESGRADTLKEAIDALETDCFRERMEAQQRELSDEIDSLRKDVIAAYYR